MSGEIRTSISKRNRNGKDFWEVEVVNAVNLKTGKLGRYSKSFPRWTLAREFEKQVMADARKGIHVSPSKMIMADLLHQWLDTHRANLKPTVYEDYECTVRVHVLPGIGTIPIQRLQPADLHNFYNTKTRAGTSANVVGKCHKRTKQALSMAVDLGYIPFNPADRAKPPREDKREMQTWTREQGKAFMVAAEKSAYGPIWLVMIGTGLRIGEALGLRWRDVDLDKGTIRVVQSVALPNDGRPYTDTPKTPSSRRPLGVTPRLVAALRDHQTKQNERRANLGADWHDHDLVFPANNGKPANRNNLTRNYNIMIERTGMARIRIHDLRHSHATWLREEGIDISGVQERLGHKKSTVTTDFYGHVSARLDSKTMEAMERAMDGF